MSVQFIGTTFAQNSQWHVDEKTLIDSIIAQINKHYSQSKSLLVNTTWFGPQFDNGEYQKFLALTNNEKFDKLFLLAAVDPVFLNADQIQSVFKQSGATELFLCGHFDSKYQFNFHTLVLPKYFHSYSDSDLKMTSPDYVYVCYNRKPRPHRIDLVQALVNNNLKQFGIISLGKNNSTYSNTNQEDLYFLLDEDPEDFAKEGNWNLPMNFGIPHDIHSLGKMDIWKRHFVNIVSETEFWPWDNLFVSEKTWKPILGLRPFLVNGQTQVYSWLGNHGFKTFEHYWPVSVANLPEYEVHQSIVNVITYLSKLSKRELGDMYNDMLPDLLYNRERFFEFAKEQQYKVNHLFHQ